MSPGKLTEMATKAPTTPTRVRDADGFGGLVPTGAVARSAETLVAALGVEHHVDGVAVSVVVLSDAPGILEWDADVGANVRDDRGERYDAQIVASTSGLGQLTGTLWIAPALPAEARRLELVVDGLARINPTRGGGRGVARPLTGGPWNLVIELIPDRTVADVPAGPTAPAGAVPPASVPVRSYGTFVDVVPVGQARLAGDVAVCAMGIERYWDRAVLSLTALGPSTNTSIAPAIGRARIEVWDDRGRAYQVAAVQGAARDGWSEVALEVLPAVPPDVAVLGIRVTEIPRGTEASGRATIPGPFTFGVRLPPGD